MIRERLFSSLLLEGFGVGPVGCHHLQSEPIDRVQARGARAAGAAMAEGAERVGEARR